MKNLNIFFISCNFKVSGSNSSLSIRHNSNSTTVVLVNIDDLIIIGNNQVKNNYIKKDLKNKFEIKDLEK
jgi:hypothetical protein